MYLCIIVPYQCHHCSSTQRHAAALRRQAELWFSYKLPDDGGWWVPVAMLRCQLGFGSI